MPFIDLVDAAKCVVKALFIREKYIKRSMQSFCKTTAHALQDLGIKPLDLTYYDDIAETPVDAGISCTHQTYSITVRNSHDYKCISERTPPHGGGNTFLWLVLIQS